MASIRKRGNKWQVRVTRKGYPPETRTFASRTDAERWGRSVESEIDKGSYTSRTAAERVTLAEIIDRYITEVSPRKRGETDEVIRLRAMKRLRFAKFSMAALTAKVVAEYRDERLKTCKANTVARDLGMLSSMINHCRREWGIAITNPVSQIRKPSMPPGRDRVLSAEEKTQLLAALVPTGKRNPYIRPLAMLALETAMRRSELLGLRWEHVDLAKRVVFLPLTKNGTERNVPLSTEAVTILQGMPRSIDGRVFPVGTAAMEAAFLRGVRRAGLHDLHFHDLRHTATTSLAEKLSNILELSAVTGHKELRMLRRYYHPKAEDIARKLS